MKTQIENTKLGFNKSAILELTNVELSHVNGGSTPLAGAAAASSAGCGAVGLAVAGAIVGAAVAITKK